MGLFEKFFTNKEEPQKTTQPPVETTYTITNEINTIYSILENLGLLDVQKIYEKVTDKPNFDINLLTRLNIKPPVGIEYLEKYFGKVRISYGSNKLKAIKTKINEIATTKALAGAPKESVLAELMNLAKSEIEAYKKILIRFNESLKQAEETAKNYVELTELIEQWKNYYKEQELGYPIQIERKIVEMSRILYDLPYGGYGEEEIVKFVDAAKKMMEEGKLNGEDTVHTHNRIVSDLFNPRKNRYLSDVETLKKKLQMIEESPYLSEFEKEQNKLKTIKEFNVMNGHKQTVTSQVEDLKENLSKLEYGGYGEEEIEQFARRAKTIIADGKRIAKPESEIKKEVRAEYQKLVDAYQTRLLQLKEVLHKIDIAGIPEKEKEQKRNMAIEDFHDEMGLPIDYKDRINAMILELKNQDHGGYGELKTREFKQKAMERLQSSKTRMEIRDALREIRAIQEGMIRDYQEELRKLELSINRVSQDRHLSEQEKGEAIDELDREFKFQMGYRMNFERYIENRAKDLKKIGERGYGENAINEFIEEAKEIAKSSGDEKEKYERIKQRYFTLRKHYENNIRTFGEWKKIQLKGKSDVEREKIEPKINRKINHMLSLSPRALQEYFLEDDRKKREKVEQHNYIAAFKFLAKQEAKHRRDETIYDKRLQELEQGKTPYTQNEIEEAAAELELISITSDDMAKEDRIISVVDYIDSTLLKQMTYAEASLLKTTNPQ